MKYKNMLSTYKVDGYDDDDVHITKKNTKSTYYMYTKYFLIRIPNIIEIFLLFSFYCFKNKLLIIKKIIVNANINSLL